MSNGGSGRVSVEILCVGDEILAGSTLNTNAGFLSRALQPMGFAVRRVTEVGDVAEDIHSALRAAMHQSSVILVTGGLGPTPDDHTKEDIAAFFEDTLERDEQVMDAMRQRFADRGVSMPAVNEKQAWIPRSATAIPNPLGSAPGVHWSRAGCEIFLMPGVPSEMEAMFAEWIRPRLQAAYPQATPLQTLVFRTTGIGESTLLERIDKVMAVVSPLRWAFYPSWHGVDVKVSGEAAADVGSAAAWRLVKDGVRSELREYLYSEDPEETVAAAVGRALVERGETMATAESCTGGLVGKHLTDVPGSSAWYAGGFVTYSNALKTSLLHVAPALLAKHGAVSAAVAAAMASAAREIAGTTYAVSSTGIAGPTGGTEDKPVGVVFLALAASQETRVRRFQFAKRRDFNRQIASQRAIDMVRRHLAGWAYGDLLEDL